MPRMSMMVLARVDSFEEMKSMRTWAFFRKA